jgi:hypothetical protein
VFQVSLFVLPGIARRVLDRQQQRVHRVDCEQALPVEGQIAQSLPLMKQLAKTGQLYA